MTLKLTTDYQDYAPGTYADFLYSGFNPGDTITFSVTALDPGPLWDLASPISPWTVIDGGTGDLDGSANGAVTTSFYINPD